MSNKKNKEKATRANKEFEEESPFLALLFYTPAIPITAILIIPLSIIFMPIIYLFKKYEIKIMRFSLYLQHSLGLAGWLITQKWLLSKIPIPLFSVFAINWIDFLIATIIAFILFYKHIKKMVDENLYKTYGEIYKD